MEEQITEKRILGLDLGIKSTGYYCKDTNLIGHFASKGDVLGVKVNDFATHIESIITEYQITDVFFEWIDEDNAPKTNHSEHATYVLNGLGLLVEAVCARLNVRCYPVKPREWKKCLFGWYSKGYEKKPQVWNKVLNMGYKPKTQDEADAIGVWYYGRNNVERLSYGR